MNLKRTFCHVFELVMKQGFSIEWDCICKKGRICFWKHSMHTSNPSCSLSHLMRCTFFQLVNAILSSWMQATWSATRCLCFLGWMARTKRARTGTWPACKNSIREPTWCQRIFLAVCFLVSPSGSAPFWTGVILSPELGWEPKTYRHCW